MGRIQRRREERMLKLTLLTALITMVKAVIELALILLKPKP